MIPDWLGLVFFVLAFAGAAVGVHIILRRSLPARVLLPHHDVAGFLVAIVGVLYAVVLGFLVVTVWSHFDAVQQTADAEAFSLGDAYGFAGALPEPQRSRIRSLIASYAIEVRDVEWTTLQHGQPDPRARAYLKTAFGQLLTVETPGNASFGSALRREAIVDNVVATLKQVWDDRRTRLIEANAHLQPALHVALLIGAFMVLGFVFLFGVENLRLQLTMTALVAGCIGLLYGLVVEFNQPYGGLIRLSPDAWTYVIEQNHWEHMTPVALPSTLLEARATEASSSP